MGSSFFFKAKDLFSAGVNNDEMGRHCAAKWPGTEERQAG